MFLYLYFFGCWKPEAITILYIRTLLGLECKHAPFAELKRRSECAIRRQRNGQNSLKASEKYMCYVAFVEMQRQKKCISNRNVYREMQLDSRWESNIHWGRLTGPELGGSDTLSSVRTLLCVMALYILLFSCISYFLLVHPSFFSNISSSWRLFFF